MNAIVKPFDRQKLADLVEWPSSPPVILPSRTGEWRLTVTICAGALGYATLRYNLFKGVPWSDWPSYVVNKGMAVAAVLLMAACAWRWRRRARTRVLIAAAGMLALAHSLLSFAMLGPVYYDRLFVAGKLTVGAGWSMVLGALAMAAMELGARQGAQWQPGQKIAGLALIAFMSGLHAAVPAVPSWFHPASWPGGLPPLTLLSFMVGIIALVALLPRRRCASGA